MNCEATLKSSNWERETIGGGREQTLSYLGFIPGFNVFKYFVRKNVYDKEKLFTSDLLKYKKLPHVL